jgi:hypothetical protein
MLLAGPMPNNVPVATTVCDLANVTLQDIMAYTADCLPSLMVLRRVCKNWHFQSSSARAHGCLAVTFTFGSRVVPSHELCTFVKWLHHSTPGVHTLSLRGCVHLTDTAVQTIGQYLGNIHKLDLELCVRLTDNCVAPIMALPNLTHLNIVGLHQLTGRAMAQLHDLQLPEFVYDADTRAAFAARNAYQHRLGEHHNRDFDLDEPYICHGFEGYTDPSGREAPFDATVTDDLYYPCIATNPCTVILHDAAPFPTALSRPGRGPILVVIRACRNTIDVYATTLDSHYVLAEYLTGAYGRQPEERNNQQAYSAWRAPRAAGEALSDGGPMTELAYYTETADARGVLWGLGSSIIYRPLPLEPDSKTPYCEGKSIGHDYTHEYEALTVHRDHSSYTEYHTHTQRAFLGLVVQLQALHGEQDGPDWSQTEEEKRHHLAMGWPIFDGLLEGTAPITWGWIE